MFATHLSLESPEVPKLCATKGQYRFFITKYWMHGCEKRLALRKRSWNFFFGYPLPVFFCWVGGWYPQVCKPHTQWCSPMLRHGRTWRSNGWVVSGHCGMWRQRDRVPWNGNSWCLSRWVNRPLGVAMPSTFPTKHRIESWPWVKSKDAWTVYGNPCLNQPLKEGVF